MRKILIDTATHFETTSVIAKFNENGYIDQIYKDFAEGDEIKELHEKMCDIFIYKNGEAKGYLADLTEFKGADPEVIEWVQEEMLPRLCINGCKYLAIVVPPNAFADFSLEMVLGKVLKLFIAEKFKDNHSASSWIAAQIKTNE